MCKEEVIAPSEVSDWTDIRKSRKACRNSLLSDGELKPGSLRQ